MTQQDAPAKMNQWDAFAFPDYLGGAFVYLNSYTTEEAPSETRSEVFIKLYPDGLSTAMQIADLQERCKSAPAAKGELRHTHKSEADAQKAHPYFCQVLQELSQQTKHQSDDGYGLYWTIRGILSTTDYLEDEKAISSTGVIQVHQPLHDDTTGEFEVHVTSWHPKKHIAREAVVFAFADEKSAQEFHQRLGANKAGEMKALWEIFQTRSLAPSKADEMFASIEKLLGKTWTKLSDYPSERVRDVKTKLAWLGLGTVDWRSMVEMNWYPGSHFWFLTP